MKKGVWKQSQAEGLGLAQNEMKDDSERHGLIAYTLLSPSLSSTASYIPVEAPEGTAARNQPLWV